jgi:tetratricopeptide (TPR) repeat protein
MLHVTGATDDFHAGPEARRIYAQAWAMVHLLIVGGKASQSAIPDMIRSIAMGDTLEGAFTKSIGMSVEQFDDALRKYVRQPAFQFVEFRVERDDAAAPVPERLQRGRLLAELAEVLVHRRHEDARAFSDAALAEDPHDARAHSARGYCHFERGEIDQARAAFAKAQELDPSDESIAAAVKRLEPVVHFAGGTVTATHSETSRTTSAEEGFRRAMHEATPQEREHLSAALERQSARVAATKRYEEAIALANAQKIDVALQMLEDLVDDPAVEQSLRDAAAAIRAEILKQTGRRE